MTSRNFTACLRFCVLGLGLALAGCTREPPAGPPDTAGRISLVPARPIVGQSFTIAELALEMRPIPAGSFRMGSPYGEPGHTSAEGPQTAVTISRPFWLSGTAVTHGQWRVVMGTDLSAQAQKAFGGANDFTRLLGRTDGAVAMYFVNWHEAMEFCAKLNARARAEGTLPAGYEFTLPTEAQWEYACRAGTAEATYAPGLDPIAWHAGNSSVGYDGPPWNAVAPAMNPGHGGRSGPRQVGLKQPNAWGLSDMLGNVYQWCRDFGADALPGGSVTDPTGPASGSDRIVRGGSWHSDASLCRAAYRAWSSPDTRLQFIGFRLALAPKRER